MEPSKIYAGIVVVAILMALQILKEIRIVTKLGVAGHRMTLAFLYTLLVGLIGVVVAIPFLGQPA